MTYKGAAVCFLEDALDATRIALRLYGQAHLVFVPAVKVLFTRFLTLVINTKEILDACSLPNLTECLCCSIYLALLYFL